MHASTPSWLRRATALIAATLSVGLSALESSAQQRPRPVVGLALAGGSAKGFAHVGVIRWLEQHRIPIDVIGGTSMGGLIGGAYASGMSSAELESLILDLDWSEVFGNTSYRFLDVARKEDARAYPSRIELHLRDGFSLPPSLDRGQQVELVLQRIVGVYGEMESFDLLPTPFRTLAVDLRTGSLIVLKDGSLPVAMRATMSIPGVFPPVRVGEQVLVDGGALNNLPADVVRQMGADVVIAVRVDSAQDTVEAETGLFGIANQTVAAMVRATTRRGAAHADIVVNAAHGFGGSDYTRAGELIEDGYRAAEAMRPKLIRLAVDEQTWHRYLAERGAKRRPSAPLLTALEVRGATPQDERSIRRRFEAHVGETLDIPALEREITRLSGLDRYTSFGWEVAREGGGNVLVIRAHPLPTAPPFLMTSMNVRRRAENAYSFQLAMRWLGYDLIGRGSQLRVDLGLGSDRGVAAELRKDIGRSPFFVAAGAAAHENRVDLFRSDEALAQYEESRVFGQLDIGFVAAHDAELRVGVRGGYYDGGVAIGSPLLPDLDGGVSEVRFRGIYDTQDSGVIPSRGLRMVGTARHVLSAPEPEIDLDIDLDGDSDDLQIDLDRTGSGLTQAELTASHFWSWDYTTRRVFLAFSGGTSFGGDPWAFDQFALGRPLMLDAFAPGQRRGNDYVVLTGGYLRSIGRLPDFLGGPVWGALWVENGSAFGGPEDIGYELQLGAGFIAETLVGPGWIGFSIGPSAHSFHVGMGRLFF